MSAFAIGLGVMIVFLSAKPTFIKAGHSIRETRRAMVELRRRQYAMSQKIRALARESLGQRLTAGQDDVESDALARRVMEMQKQIEQLEQEDRRVLVMDERRGLSETGWIICVRRRPDAASPLEPANVTRLWDEGRYVFFFATDQGRARRKAQARFLEENGFVIVDVKAHEGDLSDPPALGVHAANKQKQSA